MSENPKNDETEKPAENTKKPQAGDDFEKAWEGMMEKIEAGKASAQEVANSAEKPQVIGLTVANARKALREKLKDIKAVSQDLTPLPASAPTPDSKPTPSGRKNVEETADGVIIETEDINVEENAVLIEIFNFSKVTFLPRSAASAEMLKKELNLPKFCADEGLKWVFDGKLFTITKSKPDEAYDDKIMSKESCDFLRKLLGFFGRNTIVRPMPPRRTKPAPRPAPPAKVNISLPSGYDFFVSDSEIKEWKPQEMNLRESQTDGQDQQAAPEPESPDLQAEKPAAINLSFQMGYDVSVATPVAKKRKRKKKLYRRKKSKTN